MSLKKMIVLLLLAMLGNAAYTQSSTINEILQESKNHSILVTKLAQGGLLQSTMDSSGVYTFFAPVNSAFEQLPAGFMDSIREPQHIYTRKAILDYLTVKEKVEISTLKGKSKKEGLTLTLNTQSAQELQLFVVDNTAVIKNSAGEQAVIIGSGIIAKNGIVYFIDKVLFAK
jgi:uncharacterized surface protein with fasciclin (FAS1) repeats